MVVVGLKTHCKLMLRRTRRTGWSIRRYAHMGTGNTTLTARNYTDLSLFTSDRTSPICASVFNYLTAYSERANYPRVVAPSIWEGTVKV